MRSVETFDSTLRDGSQGEGLSFSVEDKIRIVRLLDELGVNYIEAGNPASNVKEMTFFEELRKIRLSSSEIVAFGSTRRHGVSAQEDRNLCSLLDSGAGTLAIFGKAWDFQVTDILKITLEENLDLISSSVAFLRQNGRRVFFDAEHFFDGYRDNPEYALSCLEAALDAGADLVNDIWGLKYDERMASVIAGRGAACCLMHNRNTAAYSDFLMDFMEDMRECVETARRAGIADDRILLDPGVGFGKTYEMNLEIISRLEIMHELGYPILLGTSRKSVIGLTLDLPADQREEGTLVTTVYGVQKGCAFVRVHDVEKNRRAIEMTRALMREHSLRTE